ncbi:hypothetical protein ACE6H2_006779 [Prunus campanulata]
MERSADYYQTSSFKKVMHSWLRVKIKSFAFSKNCGSSTFIIIASHKDCKMRQIDECKETLLPHIISSSHIVAAEHHHTAS